MSYPDASGDVDDTLALFDGPFRPDGDPPRVATLAADARAQYAKFLGTVMSVRAAPLPLSMPRHSMARQLEISRTQTLRTPAVCAAQPPPPPLGAAPLAPHHPPPHTSPPHSPTPLTRDSHPSKPLPGW